MDVCLLCVLSGRGLCDELITRPEESYRLWSVVVCDVETSCMRRPLPTGGVGGILVLRQRNQIQIRTRPLCGVSPARRGTSYNTSSR